MIDYDKYIFKFDRDLNGNLRYNEKVYTGLLEFKNWAISKESGEFFSNGYFFSTYKTGVKNGVDVFFNLEKYVKLW